MKLERRYCVRCGMHLLTITAVAVALTACSGYSTSNRSTDGYGHYQEGSIQEVAVDDVFERWGVRVLGIRTSAEGYMLDFRYRVLDAAKAAPLLDRRIKPYLLVEKSEAKLAVPVSSKIGALRQNSRSVKQDRNYFVMFANPGRHVKAGDRVKVVIGEFSSGELVVM